MDDKRFQSTFENVFDKDVLKDFRVLAGNHDHNGNVQAQVDYSDKSSRWNFPSLYYDFHVETQGKDLHFVFIDTVILTGNSDILNEDGFIVKERTGRELGVFFHENATSEMKLAADEQWSWLESTLQNSKADFLVVAGHYPVYSICEHGPTSELVEKLIPLLQKYKVTAYLNGHDHCAQLITDSGIDYHTIGSAHLNDPSTSHKDNIPKDSLKFHATNAVGGFGGVKVGTDGMLVVTHYDGDGTKLFEAPGRPARTSSTGSRSVRPSSVFELVRDAYSFIFKKLNE